MKRSGIILFSISVLFSFFNQAKAAEPSCRFDHKDYDSPGYGIPYRKGLMIKGRFGCVYICDCGSERVKVVTELKESHLDFNFNSKSETGGPSRARWFLCPHSVDDRTWQPFYNEIGQVIAYQVEPDYSAFDPRKVRVPILNAWGRSCQQ